MNTATDVNAPAAVASAAAVTHGVLRIEGMPAFLRPRVEALMVDCLRSESTWVVPGDDPLTAQWCTRWYKDWPGNDLVALLAGRAEGRPGIGCRQPLTGTAAELARLASELGALARAYGFTACVSM